MIRSFQYAAARRARRPTPIGAWCRPTSGDDFEARAQAWQLWVTTRFLRGLPRRGRRHAARPDRRRRPARPAHRLHPRQGALRGPLRPEPPARLGVDPAARHRAAPRGRRRDGDRRADPDRQDALRSLAARPRRRARVLGRPGPPARRRHRGPRSACCGRWARRGRRPRRRRLPSAPSTIAPRPHEVIEPVVVADLGGAGRARRAPARRAGGGHRRGARSWLEGGAGEIVLPGRPPHRPGRGPLATARMPWSSTASSSTVGEVLGPSRPATTSSTCRGVGADVAVAHLLVAPTRGAPLHAERPATGASSRRSTRCRAAPGIGAHLGRPRRPGASRIDALGGKIVGTLPLLASWLDEPFEPEPVRAGEPAASGTSCSSTSPRCPELAGARRRPRQPRRPRAPSATRPTPRAGLFDYRHQYGYVHGVLEELVGGIDRVARRARRPSSTPGGRAVPTSSATPASGPYADRTGAGLAAWPEPQRAGALDRRRRRSRRRRASTPTPSTP